MPFGVVISIEPATITAIGAMLTQVQAIFAAPLNTRAQLDRIEAALGATGALMINVSALLAAVAREKTVDDSILALVTQMAANQVSLSKQLADAIANNDPVAMAAVQKQLDDSATKMTENADAIAASVLANTPAATSAP